VAAAAAAAELVHSRWQLQGNRTRRRRSRFSHGIHSHSRRGRAHRWGALWRRPRCRTAGRHCGTGCPLAPCSDSPGRRTAAWRVSPGSRSWPLLALCRWAQSGAASNGKERLAVLRSRAAGSIHQSEPSTRAARALALQPALALGFCAAVGRSIRGALPIGPLALQRLVPIGAGVDLHCAGDAGRTHVVHGRMAGLDRFEDRRPPQTKPRRWVGLSFFSAGSYPMCQEVSTQVG
jgi:hypothetical protein